MSTRFSRSPRLVDLKQCLNITYQVHSPRLTLMILGWPAGQRVLLYHSLSTSSRQDSLLGNFYRTGASVLIWLFSFALFGWFGRFGAVPSPLGHQVVWSDSKCGTVVQLWARIFQSEKLSSSNGFGWFTVCTCHQRVASGVST